MIFPVEQVTNVSVTYTENSSCVFFLLQNQWNMKFVTDCDDHTLTDLQSNITGSQWIFTDLNLECTVKSIEKLLEFHWISLKVISEKITEIYQ